jgi:hypothetical protein
MTFGVLLRSSGDGSCARSRTKARASAVSIDASYTAIGERAECDPQTDSAAEDIDMRLGFLPLFALAALSACAEISDDEPFETTQQYAIDRSVERPAEDDMLLLSNRVDAFAGYWCADGDLHIGLTQRASTADEATIVRLVDSMGVATACYNRDVGLRTPSIVVAKRSFNFLTLRTFRDSIVRELFSIDGVNSLGIDYQNNRLMIGADAAAVGAVERFAASRMPREAYTVEEQRRATLHAACPFPSNGPFLDNARCPNGESQCCFRPVPGGASHQPATYGGRAAVSDNGTLTLGAERFYPEHNNWYLGWVTCSHCVAPQTVMNSGYVSQYRANPSNMHFIGIEAVDPPGFYCNLGNRCRYSDATWVTANIRREVSRGTIVQPLLSWTTFTPPPREGGTKVASTSHPRFYVAGKRTPVQGMQVEKVGQASGWTTGIITATCTDYSQGDGHIRVLCNSSSTHWGQGGDSGSPVFYWWWFYGVDTVEMIGVDWGGNEIDREHLSNWANVELDLGTMNIAFAPGWQQVTSTSATDVGVGANDAVWIISGEHIGGGNYTIKRLTNTAAGAETWETVPGHAARIAVEPNGNAWVANAAGFIYRWDGTTWQLMPGLASDIGIGANGTVWVIGTDGGTYRWNGSGWTAVPGAAVRVSVDPSGNAWVVNSFGEVYRYVSGSFQKVSGPGTATDIGIAPDGLVWILGTNSAYGYDIKWWTGRSWQQVPGAARAIAGGRGGTPWVANASQQLFRSF